MFIYEIVIGMMLEKYTDGCVFRNADMGDIYIKDGELLWCDNTPFTIMVKDESRWELVR